MEINGYYLYIFSAVIFLFYIQIRGIFGKNEQKHKTQRYKKDALEYYDLDIDWFAFNFVMLSLHLYSIARERNDSILKNIERNIR